MECPNTDTDIESTTLEVVEFLIDGVERRFENEEIVIQAERALRDPAQHYKYDHLAVTILNVNAKAIEKGDLLGTYIVDWVPAVGSMPFINRMDQELDRSWSVDPYPLRAQAKLQSIQNKESDDIRRKEQWYAVPFGWRSLYPEFEWMSDGDIHYALAYNPHKLDVVNNNT